MLPQCSQLRCKKEHARSADPVSPKKKKGNTARRFSVCPCFDGSLTLCTCRCACTSFAFWLCMCVSVNECVLSTLFTFYLFSMICFLFVFVCDCFYYKDKTTVSSQYDKQIRKVKTQRPDNLILLFFFFCVCTCVNQRACSKQKSGVTSASLK